MRRKKSTSPVCDAFGVAQAVNEASFSHREMQQVNGRASDKSGVEGVLGGREAPIRSPPNKSKEL